MSRENEADLESLSARLSVRAGLVSNFGSGTWSYTHLGRRVLDNLESIIRDEIDQIAQEVMMHQLQSSEIWRESGRWENFESNEFFSLTNRDGRDFTIAATHEEAATVLASEHIRSYRDLDLAFYQIGRKFRDDRARKGLLRAKEFIMKDAYSFHADREGLDERYQSFLMAYRNIFDRMGLEYSEVAADNGSMGGSDSHEFIAHAEAGSELYLRCTECRYGTKDMGEQKCSVCGSELEEADGIEIGHCFKLEDRYSGEDSIGLTYIDSGGEERKVLMASYGIGVSRLISALIEQQNDEKGIKWNSEVSAFEQSIILASDDSDARERAEELYSELGEEDTLFFDGEQSVGEKFAESDLIGTAEKYIVGNRYLEEGVVEVEDREGDMIREIS